MRIGVFVHSRTGHTKSVAKRLINAMKELDIDATLQYLVASDDLEINANKVKLVTHYDIRDFDIIVFGSPVRALSLSATMQAFILSQDTLKDKVVFGFVTQGSPFRIIGGNKAIRKLKKICLEKNVVINNTAIINWAKEKTREKQIIDAIRMVSNDIARVLQGEN